jgi:hypothetical protein
MTEIQLYENILFGYIASNKSAVSEWWIGKDVEGSGSGLI